MKEGEEESEPGRLHHNHGPLLAWRVGVAQPQDIGDFQICQEHSLVTPPCHPVRCISHTGLWIYGKVRDPWRFKP